MRNPSLHGKIPSKFIYCKKKKKKKVNVVHICKKYTIFIIFCKCV